MFFKTFLLLTAALTLSFTPSYGLPTLAARKVQDSGHHHLTGSINGKRSPDTPFESHVDVTECLESNKGSHHECDDQENPEDKIKCFMELKDRSFTPFSQPPGSQISNFDESEGDDENQGDTNQQRSQIRDSSPTLPDAETIEIDVGGEKWRDINQQRSPAHTILSRADEASKAVDTFDESGLEKRSFLSWIKKMLHLQSFFATRSSLTTRSLPQPIECPILGDKTCKLSMVIANDMSKASLAVLHPDCKPFADSDVNIEHPDLSKTYYPLAGSQDLSYHFGDTNNHQAGWFMYQGTRNNAARSGSRCKKYEHESRMYWACWLPFPC